MNIMKHPKLGYAANNDLTAWTSDKARATQFTDQQVDALINEGGHVVNSCAIYTVQK